MPMRNPFRKAGVTSGVEAPSENGGPGPHAGLTRESSSALSVKSTGEEPNEYKMSVVKDGGVYLPPSPPPEKNSFWSRSHSSTTSSNHRSMLSENGPFSISRESFESYRRSFDISARSPVVQPDVISPRHSVDSRPARLPNARQAGRRVDQQAPIEDETFEDVGLGDEVKPKRRTLFSRFGDSSENNTSPTSTGGSHHHGFSFTGRKRGHSGQGAELGKISRPVSSGASEIKVET